MAKMTLLQMTQNILSAMDSDEVNSISDTVESEQVAEVIKETYYQLVDELQLPSQHKLVQLESALVATPTKMQIPDTVQHLLWIKYDVREDPADDVVYRTVQYLSPDDFIDHIMRRAESDSTVTKITDGGVDLLIRNDKGPTYWTSFNDKDILFDSYDSNIETNLQNAKSLCYGETGHNWTHTDAAIPELPENLHSLLLSEAKSTCFFNFKQSVNQKAEQINRRRRVAARKDKWAVNGGIKRPDYGRK